MSRICFFFVLIPPTPKFLFLFFSFPNVYCDLNFNCNLDPSTCDVYVLMVEALIWHLVVFILFFQRQSRSTTRQKYTHLYTLMILFLFSPSHSQLCEHYGLLTSNCLVFCRSRGQNTPVIWFDNFLDSSNQICSNVLFLRT